MQKVETTDIIREISRLPVSQRLLIVENIVRSLRLEQEQPLEKAPSKLYSDYLADKDLTVFTLLDSEQFYETR